MSVRRVYLNFSEVDGAVWNDKPVAVIGAGASMRGIDLRRIKNRCYIIAVKSMIFDLPYADCGFGLDKIELRRWWRILRYVRFPVYWAIDPDWIVPALSKPDCLRFLRRDTQAALSRDPGLIHGGGTSGFGALNLAVLKGARWIFLFGFDYGDTLGEWHANPAHYRKRTAHKRMDWDAWSKSFDNVADELRENNVSVINASPHSRITAFPRVTIDQACCMILGADRGFDSSLRSATLMGGNLAVEA